MEPAVRPPHLLTTALPGPRPPVPIPDLLARVVEGADSSGVTPALHRFLSAAARKELGETLAGATSWTALGCDPLANRRIRLLGAPIERAYARASGPSEQDLFTVFNTSDWRAAHLDFYTY